MTTSSGESRRYSVEEYLRLELDSSDRHEFYNGQIVGMAGGSPEHSLITGNVLGELRSRLKEKPCRVYDANLRVGIPRSGLYVYPDVTMVCGPPERDPQDIKGMTISNPKLIVEVLSPSTEHLDYGPKFQNYLKCPSLEEYVLVSQDRVHVQSYFRQPGGTWLFTPVMERTGQIILRSLGIELPLEEIYARVEIVEKAEEGPI